MNLKNSERLDSVSKRIAAACFMLLALEEQSASHQTSPYQIHNHLPSLPFLVCYTYMHQISLFFLEKINVWKITIIGKPIYRIWGLQNIVREVNYSLNFLKPLIA